VAATPSDAAKLAIEAGSDMDMEGNCYGTSLVKLVNDGKVDVKLIDDAVRRVLRVKFRLGLFDNPYLYCDSVREKERTLTPTNLALSREIAKRSIVLLKNDKQILPLETKFKRVAVIGQLAADKDSPLGSWRAKAETLSAVSVLEGLRTAYAEKGVAVTYARGPEYTDSVNVFSKEVRINTTDRAGLPEAVALAKNSDAVVLVLGENCYQSGEGRSQVEIGLKGLQLELFEAVVKANPNVVLVLMNGRPLDLSAVVGKVPAIVEAWHLGSESGNAIADVLTGAYNPSGKLPMSFPRSVGQVPIYYNANNTGRPNPGDVFWSHYTDSPNTPLFPFGFGLSYTTFEYSDLSLSANKLTSDKPLTISVKVSNKGARDGEEVVQLYVRDLVGSIARPVKELKGFRKVAIKAGETKEVKFEISAKDLAFYTRAKKWETEAGDFTLWVGTNSTEGLTANFAY
jgi:beta-glucosidase